MKQELVAAIKAEGNWDNRQLSPAWSRAFDAFNNAPENKGNRLMASCGSCWPKVREWLLR